MKTLVLTTATVSSFISDAHHRYSAKESDWGFNQMVKFADLTVPNPPSQRMILENDCFTLVAYVRIIKDSNGTLWHDLVE